MGNKEHEQEDIVFQDVMTFTDIQRNTLPPFSE
jgi:hypothetical protein